MKEVTLKIPEQRMSFFLELMEQLGFEITEPWEISEEHKTIVRERIKESEKDPSRLLDWDSEKKNFKFD